jgi:hypothetical protein
VGHDQVAISVNGQGHRHTLPVTAGGAHVTATVGEASGVQTQPRYLSPRRIERLGEDPPCLHGHSNES